MRNPSPLRFVECELPDDIEKTLIAFEDDFDANLQPFYDRLQDFILNDLPPLLPELESQIALRDQLLNGAPVQGLSSLAAMDETIKLTNPQRNDDPELIRIDERKLGAVGILLLNGRMFKIIEGTRLKTLRYLWSLAGGDYSLFISLGSAVVGETDANFILLEGRIFDVDSFPYVNQGFDKLKAEGVKNSLYQHRIIWKESISASYGVKNQLTLMGFDFEQINNVFAGSDPDSDFDFIGTLDDINNIIIALTRLIFMPPTDPLRQPPWENELNYILLALQTYLEYRTRKNTSSSVFETTFWESFITEMKPNDIKELLENRPEINDVELPQDLESITQIVEKAITLGSESTTINTYMVNLPDSSKEETTLRESLYDLGLEIHAQSKSVLPKKAKDLENLLLELMGISSLVGEKTPNVLVNPADLSSLFPSINLPPVGDLVNIISSIDGGKSKKLVNKVIQTNSALKKFQKKEVKVETEKTVENNEQTTAPGTSQGLPSVETPAMILTRRVKWNDNFVSCSVTSKGVGQQTVEQAAAGAAATGDPSVAVTAAALGVAEATKGGGVGTKSTTEAAAPSESGQTQTLRSAKGLEKDWGPLKQDLEYLKKTLGIQNVSIAAIRKGVNKLSNDTKESSATAKTGQSSKASGNSGGSVPAYSSSDEVTKALLLVINSSEDIKKVTVAAAQFVKKNVSVETPNKIQDEGISASVKIAKTFQAIDRQVSKGVKTDEKKVGWTSSEAAAKNRRFIQTQQGKKGSPGLTAGEVNRLNKGKLGLPFLGKKPIAFKRKTTAELKFCQPTAMTQFGDYLDRNRKTIQMWLVKLINIIKHVILQLQDKIDAWILAFQTALDTILSKLERLLTIDLNFSGKTGFENSLIKCAWSLDLGLKLDLMAILLFFLNKLLEELGAPLLKALKLWGDFLTEIFCIPIRWLEVLLGRASDLLGLIGCTIKDFKLPTEILDLLKLLQGSFKLRSITCKKGGRDWLSALARLKKQKNEFNGLSQFASLCQNVKMSEAMQAMQKTATAGSTQIPFANATQTAKIAMSVAGLG
jgi:hypothetical protein